MDISSNVINKILHNSRTIFEYLEYDIRNNPSAYKDNVNYAERINHWCEIVADGNWDKFEKRLSWDGINFQDVYNSSPLSISAKKNQTLPKWAEVFVECLKNIHSCNSDQINTYSSKDSVPFEEVWLPFILFARNKLCNETNFFSSHLSQEAQIEIEYSLLELLSAIGSPSLQLYFSAFRSAKKTTLLRIISQEQADTNEIYKQFVNSLLSGDLLEFFEDYPVIARLVGTTINLWIESTKELVDRLEADWIQIQELFSINNQELGKVISLQINKGDRHRGGRSVTIITFESGLKISYKPRNLEICESYNLLLNYFNRQDKFIKFKVLKVLSRKKYGWLEFVEQLPCNGSNELRLYYQRSGALLCLAYLLGATDLHFENVIAHGEHPVLIDLETLLHPKARTVDNHKFTPNAEYLAIQRLSNSVLTTGLLPWNLPAENNFNQSDSYRYIWNNVNTDQMELVYQLQTSKYNSDLSGIKLSTKNDMAVRFNDAIIDGFKMMYKFLMDNKKTLSDIDSPLRSMADKSVRFIFRTTSTYSSVISKSLQPKYLKNGFDWSIQLDILSKPMLYFDNKPYFFPLLRYERMALEQLDIPTFIADSGSNKLNIFFDNNKDSISDFFEKPSFNRALDKLNELDQEDLKLQINFISFLRQSYLETSNHYNYTLSDSLEMISSIGISLSQLRLLEQAKLIGSALKDQSIYATDDGSMTWIAPQYHTETQRFYLKPLDYNLYSGSGGISIFLAALYKVTNNIEFYNLAKSSIQSLCHDLRHLKNSSHKFRNIGIGGAEGLGSLLTVLTYTSSFLDLPELIDYARQLSYLITPDLITADNRFDIISGSAGAILGLSALYNISTDLNILKQAIICGHNLLNNRSVEDNLLTGFSHGSAGIAYALLRLYQASGETAFLEAAQEAIAYERSVFIPELNNWPDFRQPQTKDNPKCMCSWCHGAPGIGLARVATLDILDTPEIRQDIEAAITTTLNYGLSDIDHLCCGNMGRVEFLFTAGRKLNRPELVDAAMKLASQVVARAEEKSHYGYGSVLAYNPGFFQGASGIGYQLLRLAYPNQLPSVLLWE